MSLVLQNEIALRAAQYDNTSAGVLLLQTLLALAFVVGLAYLILRVLLPRMAGRAFPGAVRMTESANGLMRCVDTLHMGTPGQLHIIEIAGRYYLIAATTGGTQMLTELSAEHIGMLLSAAQARQPHHPLANLRDVPMPEWLSRVLMKKP
ncbi:MAG: flagellar biosynthetic protein FliO [Blastocatellia bacterium]